MITELIPKYDSRKSFYSKALVDISEEEINLISYSTNVARYNKVADTISLFGYFSDTTARHIREFCLQLDFESPTKKQMENSEVLKK